MDNFGTCGRELSKATYPNGDNASSCSELETLSDIDDIEVDSYINNEKEKYYKKIIWENLNSKYLQEQQAKKTAAATNTPKPKKENRPKKSEEVKKAPSSAQASKKRASSRVNYDVLSKLVDEPSSSDNPKRSRTESKSDKTVGSSVKSPLTDDEVDASLSEYEEWEENPDYSYYNDQEEDFEDYYIDDEDTF